MTYSAASNEFTALRRSDITGDFDVVVKVTSLTANSVNSKAALFMADNFASLGSGGYAGISLRGDGKVEFLTDVAGNVGEIEDFFPKRRADYAFGRRSDGRDMAAFGQERYQRERLLPHQPIFGLDPARLDVHAPEH